MDLTIEEYLEDTKRHLTYLQNEDELKTHCTFNYTYDKILENKEYFEFCLREDISTYVALLFFWDYLCGDVKIK